MVFSRACKYGLRAMLYLASQPPRRPILVREVAESADLPSQSLAKVIPVLTRGHLIQPCKEGM